MHHQFSLKPFADGRSQPDLGLTGTLTRQGNLLHIEYLLSGDLAKVVLPEPVPQPDRRDNLWQGTCFEFFLARAGVPAYWEFNLSPEHHWNVYGFDDYRQGMRPEPDIDELPCETTPIPTGYQLSLSFNLDRWVEPSQPLEVGITTVIASRSSESDPYHLSYWALAHPGAEPDFHRRDSFCLKILGT